MNQPVVLQISRVPLPRMSPGSCSVEVQGLRVMADIGVHAHEMGRRQPLELDIDLELRNLPQADAIEVTVDYSHIVSLAQDLGARRTALIETFARTLAEQLLEHVLVESVSINVRKPRALPGCVAGCRVRLCRG